MVPAAPPELEAEAREAGGGEGREGCAREEEPDDARRVRRGQREHQRRRKQGVDDGAEECAGHDARELEVVVVGERRRLVQQVVHRLKVEGLLDLVVRGHVEVREADKEVGPVPLIRVWERSEKSLARRRSHALVHGPSRGVLLALLQERPVLLSRLRVQPCEGGLELGVVLLVRVLVRGRGALLSVGVDVEVEVFLLLCGSREVGLLQRLPSVPN
mmetsp:Transcript_61210/g.145119  ORF Transcript_61210/g.145119 Transcript_61210/m.145119 type:complete len:216 (-) Transcript_61210:406-1053(-)